MSWPPTAQQGEEMSWPPTAQQGNKLVQASLQASGRRYIMQNAVEELVGVDFNTTSLHLIFVSHVVQNLFHFGKKEIHSEFSQC